MFKSRKSSSSHQISPLAPPSPASTNVRSPSFDANGNGNVIHGNGNDSGLTPNGGSTAPPPPQPGYMSGNPMDRAISVGQGSVKEGKEKRRSGFFGLGGHHKKDKEKEREEKELPRPRPSSFSIERPPPQANTQTNRSQGSNTSHSMGRPQSEQMLQAQPMRQFPGPGSGTASPPISRSPLSQQQSSQGQIVSLPAGQGAVHRQGSGEGVQPQQYNNQNGQGGLPKSQSMGFAPRQGSGLNGQGQIPDTHPYRGYLNGQQDQQSQPQTQVSDKGMHRSSSMPLDRQNQVPPPSRSPTTTTAKPNGSSGVSPQRRSAHGIAQNGLADTSAERFERIVELIALQPQKTYVASPPELEMILARTSAGGQPKQGQPGSATNDWDSVWLQLSGISLSMWSMKETRLAAAKGEKVPPTYFNITDSSLELLAPLPPPPHRPTSHPHRFVYSLNTAGSNRLLFSCPSERDLARWTTALRLAAWERARLEEIYTGHLIQAGGREPRSELIKGRLEGWVRTRVMGGTDWKRLWMVLSTPGSDETSKDEEKKGRRRSFFGMGEKEKEQPVQEPNTGVSMASFYLEPRTAKNRTSVVSVLTITSVTQAYAVFPERLEVMAQSNLYKIVGRVSGEMVTIEGRLRDSGWALIMPEQPGEGGGSPSGHQNGNHAAGDGTPLSNMMRWVTGFHDVFGLYGRPEKYNWDQRDSRSLFFAYPQGDDRNGLFLDIEEAVRSDFRTSNLASIRAQFTNLVRRRMNGSLNGRIEEDEEEENPTPRPEGNYRLPPLSFGDQNPQISDQSVPRSLTPITERTDIASRENSTRTARSQFTVGTASDRKVSGGSSKQGSGGSNKHLTSAHGDERLAPIADSSRETFGPLTEEPSESKSPIQPTPTATTESQTASTVWSQDTGATPTPQQSNGASPRSPQHTSEMATSTTPTPGPVREPEQEPMTASRQVQQKPSSPVPVLATPIQGVLSPTPRRASSGDPLRPVGGDLHEEPAAMYLMNMVEEPQPVQPDPATVRKSVSPDRVRPTINTDFDGQSKIAKQDLGRKPSGARAPPPRKTSGSRHLETIGDKPEEGERVAQVQDQPSTHDKLPSSATQPDLGEDVSAFINYAENPSPVKQKVLPAPAKATSPGPKQEEFRSSFAPSKAAAERRAKAEQAAADHQRAMNVPGGGRRRGVQQSNMSDSEEDEEDDEEPSPVVEKRHVLPPLPSTGSAARGASDPPVQRSTSTTRALPPVPRPAPDGRGPNGDPRPRDSYFPFNQQSSAEQQGSRSRSPVPPPVSTYTNGPTPRDPPQPAPPAARQTVWNANFSAEHGMPAENRSGKFVELEEPQAQLTKAFAPHGLLQAGMQDKEDRSAKKQEEVARETGSSLINVPAKPPPPQSGLLGAVAAHERDRKNAGGIGATLTDREREKRLAEERQREIDRLQRQQMEHMRHFGGGSDMYSPQQGYPYGMGMPQMGMNMGMMGMPPMGYSYHGGYNPYAQQQAMMAAQMAYQQALMAMSQSGSQAGDYPEHAQTPPGAGAGQASGPDGRSTSPVGSVRSQNHSPPPVPQFYGYPPPMGSPMGMPRMGMPMGMPWMMPPASPGMWGSPSPTPGQNQGGPGQYSHMNDWLHPQQGGQPGGGGSSDAGSHRSRVASVVSNGDDEREKRQNYS
ncbi:hypothetical protein IAR55_004363 [Kwoniella newhampshirensis]|uniref:PH domain-containing protein n=1 Tax=Kwoniella newhampshirensis TaxID=1651941 RepID=A0AAW0Z0G5_9TREE